MSYQGTERRDTTAKGRAIRELVKEMCEMDDMGNRLTDEWRPCDFAASLGRLWTTAHAQGRADLARDMRDDFDAKLRSLLEEYGVR